MAVYPTTGSVGWGPALKSYIDDGASAAQADAARALQQLAPGDSWASIQAGGAEHGTITGYGEPFGLSQTRSAIRACIAAGLTFLDLDVRYDANGVLWCYHQPRAEWTNITSSAVDTDNPGLSWLQSYQVSSLLMVPEKTVGGSYAPEPLMRLEDVMDEFGWKVPIVVEPKNQSAPEDWQRSVTLISELIARKGMQDRVAVSFSPTDAFTFKIPMLKAAGIQWFSVYADATWCNDDDFIDGVEAAGGCAMVSLSYQVDDTHLARWKTVALQVVGDTYARRSGTAAGGGTVASWQSRGVNLFLGNHMSYTLASASPIKHDTWRYGYWHGGDIAADTSTRPKLQTSGLLFDVPDSAGYQGILAGDFGPLPDEFQLDLSFTINELNGAYPRIGVMVCSQTDKTWVPGIQNDGYWCSIAAGSGDLSLDDYSASSTATNRATGTSSALSAATQCYLRVVVDATSVTVSRVDAAGTLVGTAATWSDASFRNGFLHVVTRAGTGAGSVGPVVINSLDITAL